MIEKLPKKEVERRAALRARKGAKGKNYVSRTPRPHEANDLVRELKGVAGMGLKKGVKLVDEAEEILTDLGEQEDAANARNERAEMDELQKHESPPMSYSKGGIDGRASDRK